MEGRIRVIGRAIPRWHKIVVAAIPSSDSISAQNHCVSKQVLRHDLENTFGGLTFGRTSSLVVPAACRSTIDRVHALHHYAFTVDDGGGASLEHVDSMP